MRREESKDGGEGAGVSFSRDVGEGESEDCQWLMTVTHTHTHDYPQEKSDDEEASVPLGHVPIDRLRPKVATHTPLGRGHDVPGVKKVLALTLMNVCR